MTVYVYVSVMCIFQLTFILCEIVLFAPVAPSECPDCMPISVVKNLLEIYNEFTEHMPLLAKRYTPRPITSCYTLVFLATFSARFSVKISCKLYMYKLKLRRT